MKLSFTMNNLPEWDQIETGIVEIDIQHKTLYNILKILKDAIENNKSSMVIKYIIDEIVRYGVYHMEAEEEILKKYNLLSERHSMEHQSFRIMVNGFKEKYSSTRDKVLAKEIHDNLHYWITTHIMGTDKKDIANLILEFKRLGKGDWSQG